MKASTVLLSLGLAASSLGQSFNVDLDTLAPETGGGVPSSSFGAAANQPGVWNSVSVAGGADWLYDLNGVQRNVSITQALANGGYSGGGFANQSNTGDFARLLNDEGSVMSAWRSWTFHGLSNGMYQVVTYAVTPFPSFNEARVSLNGGPVSSVTGPMPGNQFIVGITHCSQTTIVTNGDLEIRVLRQPLTEGLAVNGFQLTAVPEPVTLTALLIPVLALVRRRK